METTLIDTDALEQLDVVIAELQVFRLRWREGQQKGAPMGAAQIMQLALALLALVQNAMASGIFDPDTPIELTTLGNEHRDALEALRTELGH